MTHETFEFYPCCLVPDPQLFQLLLFTKKPNWISKVDAIKRKKIALKSCFVWNFKKSNSSYQSLLLNIADMIREVCCQKNMQNQIQLWATFHLGVSTFLRQMTQIRHRGMINVIAWVIAGLIDGWPLLIKSLWQIMYFFLSKGKRAAELGGKYPDKLVQYWLCHLWCVWLQSYNYFERF